MAKRWRQANVARRMLARGGKIKAGVAARIIKPWRIGKYHGNGGASGRQRSIIVAASLNSSK